jgi:hypothetical protein
MRVVCWQGLIAALVVPQAARAQPEMRAPLQLAWQSPDGCPDAARARAEIEQLLGHPPDAPIARAVSADVRIEPAAPRWHMTLRLTRPDSVGERSIDGGSCEEVASAAELVIAMALDPTATMERTRRPIVSATATAPAPAAPKEGSGVALLVRGEIDLGSLPAPAPGARVGVEAALGRIRGEVAASYFPPQPTRTTGGTISLISIGVRAGSRFSTHRFELTPSLGVELGSMAGKGFGLDVNGGGWGVWIVSTATIAAGVELTRWLGLAVELTGGVTLRGPTFVVEGVGTVHRPALLFGRGAIRLEVRLP